MPYCPNCHWEYVEGSKHCSDCGSELVDELEPPERFPEEIETVECFTADDEIEAEIVKDILHQNHIPCILTSQYSHLIHPFSHIGASGQVAVLVPTAQHDEALQIIKDYQAEKGVVIDNDFTNAIDDEIEDFEDDEFDDLEDDLDDYGDYDDFDDTLDDDDDEY